MSKALLHAIGRIVLDNVLALCLLLLAVFTLLHFLPGEPLDALYSSELAVGLDAAGQQAMKDSYGLSGSIMQRMLGYLGHVLRGDLGFSLVHAAPVSQLIGQSLPWSLTLVLLSVPLSMLLGIAPGLWAGSTNNYRVDRRLVTASAVLSSLPSFTLALLLLSVFSMQLQWFPIAGAEQPFSMLSGWRLWLDRFWHAVLPVLVLSLHGALRFFYVSRGLAQQLRERPFITAAQARGVGRLRLLTRYYWPNAFPDILTRMTGVLPSVLGATLFVETVFSYPGIGQLLLSAIYTRDFPLIQGVVISFGGVILLTNTLIDLMVLRLNHRG